MWTNASDDGSLAEPQTNVTTPEEVEVPPSAGSNSSASSQTMAFAASTSRILTLYHQTSPEIAQKILQGGFRPGTSGWCGGAIYFAVSPADTDKKTIAANSHKGYIIEARVDVGRVAERPSKCGVWDGATLQRMGFDSIKFNPGDGDEYVIYSNSRVLSMKHYR